MSSATSSQSSISQQTEQQTASINRHKFRHSLPSSMTDRSKNSIWSILKQCVDKELYRFTIPIVWNEPLSLLQRMAENMKYSHQLLDKAAECNNPVDRMKYVVGFLVSGTSIHNNRISKPFNPLLGETYEYVCTENNFRVCCEQVSHHPPISAYYSESIKPSSSSAKWKYYGSVNPQLKLSIMHASIEAFPEEFPEFDETYTWHNIKVNAHNIVIGKLWFEYIGRVEILNHKNKMKCILDFKPYSWFSGQMSRCDGYIVDADDKVLCLLNGKWDECFFSTDETSSSSDFAKKCDKLIKDDTSFKASEKKIQLIWKTSDVNLNPEHYLFSEFTYKLNEIYDDLLKDTRFKVTDEKANKSREVSLGPLPITDSRFRPDMRLYENGKIESAAHEKNRLEEKQRETRNKIDNGELKQWTPLWFEKKPHFICTNEETWAFNHNYWKRDYSKCPHIY